MNAMTLKLTVAAALFLSLSGCVLIDVPFVPGI